MPRRGLMAINSRIWTFFGLATLSLGLLSTACGMDPWIPDTASKVDAGPSHSLQTTLDSRGTRSLPDGVSSLKIEIIDILLRDTAKDKWLIVNDQTVMFEPTNSKQNHAPFSALPLPDTEFDAVRVVLGDVTVGYRSKSVLAQVSEAEITLKQKIKLGGDRELRVAFELNDALRKAGDGAFVFDPQVVVEVRKSSK